MRDCRSDEKIKISPFRYAAFNRRIFFRVASNTVEEKSLLFTTRNVYTCCSSQRTGKKSVWSAQATNIISEQSKQEKNCTKCVICWHHDHHLYTVESNKRTHSHAMHENKKKTKEEENDIHKMLIAIIMSKVVVALLVSDERSFECTSICTQFKCDAGFRYVFWSLSMEKQNNINLQCVLNRLRSSSQ